MQNNCESYAIVSAGEGLQDYDCPMYNIEKQIKDQGNSDNTCSMILWSISK